MGSQDRKQLYHFIADKNESRYTRLAMGITELSGSLNPKTKEVTYINDYVETINSGYQNSWPVSGDFYDENPASELLWELCSKIAKDDDAVVYFLQAWGWEAHENDAAVFRGFKQKCLWVPSNDGGGTGGEKVTFGGTLTAKGPRIEGWIRVKPADLAKDEEFETAEFSENEPPVPEEPEVPGQNQGSGQGSDL